MKISVWCPYYPPHTGGLETYAEDLHRELARLGNQITVFTPDLPPHHISRPDADVKIIRYPAFDLVYNFPVPKFWQAAWWKNLNLFIGTDADVLVSYTRFFLSSFFALLHARLKKIPWAHVEHGSGYVASNRPLVIFFSRLVDHTWGRFVFHLSSLNIAPSQSAQKFISRFDSRPVPVIYRGLDYQNIDSILPDQSLRDKYPGQTIIVYAGRLISGKNVASLVSAMAVLKAKSVVLFIVGVGEEEKQLHILADNLGLTKQIVFQGRCSWTSTISLLKVADIVVNPSLNEGLPTLVLEAAACGQAIIATAVGGTPEIIISEFSGILYDPRDSGALVEHLNNLLDKPTLRRHLGQQARTQIETKFNWDKATHSFVHILSELH